MQTTTRSPSAQASLARDVATESTFFTSLCRAAVLRYLSRIHGGQLDVSLPDGTHRMLGGAGGSAPSRLRILRNRFFTRTALHGDIGFGESYVDGDWDTDDLTGLLTLLVGLDTNTSNRSAFSATRLTQQFHRLVHRLRPNTLSGSRKNIEAHYDLSNDLFATFLDPSMMYSCAIYAEGDSLAQAQQRRIATIIKRADIQSHHHVLEIGSGWGALAIEMARSTGCRVTSITVSTEQHELASRRVREAGLQDRVSIELIDYREVQGRYDRVVSIEMLEAVGEAHLRSFFEVCDQRLLPGGQVFLQVITLPDQRYEAYRKGCDWIQKHIFPGGFLPSLSALSDTLTRHTRFVVDSLHNIGPHYATTLRDWRNAFLDHAEEVDRLGFDESFRRKWAYYLSYCEAGFATRNLNTLHLSLTRAGEPRDSIRSAPGA